MANIMGKASGAEKNTIIQIIICGDEDGILNSLDYKIIGGNTKLEDFLESMRAGIVGVSATEVIEEIVVANILENIELDSEELYVADLIEKVFQKAIFDYLQVQLEIPIEQKYEE